MFLKYLKITRAFICFKINILCWIRTHFSTSLKFHVVWWSYIRTSYPDKLDLLNGLANLI